MWISTFSAFVGFIVILIKQMRRLSEAKIKHKMQQSFKPAGFYGENKNIKNE